MNRINIIQSLIDRYGFKKYLEVGVQAGLCFNTIQCERKVGVDPDPLSAATVHKTSDDFFSENKETFDIAFSDGLHHSENSERDLLNMLAILNDGGIIVAHDMLPVTKRGQEIPQQEQIEWNGNVWESWVKLRMTNPDIEMYCINTDWGTSVIRKGKQSLLTVNVPITYENFCIHKQEWMNIISVEDFKRIFLNS